MGRIKYYYDSHTCKYERISKKKGDRFFDLLSFLSLTLVVAVFICFLYVTYFDSPKERQLLQENEALQTHYKLLQQQMGEVQKELNHLQERDDDLYRVIFEAEPVASSIRQAGIGGGATAHYQNLAQKGALILETTQRVEKLKNQLRVQHKSYDEILAMARNKGKMLASIPAIAPVDIKDLERISSGFGMRLHPVLKVRRPHTGMDFAAPIGTPVYASGDGRVRRAQKGHNGGLGYVIEIDHGFGYVTQYAHLRQFYVKPGQHVKRGQRIGAIGNTGLISGTHLHYVVMKNKVKVNPVDYLYQGLTATQYAEVKRLAAIENQSLD